MRWACAVLPTSPPAPSLKGRGRAARYDAQVVVAVAGAVAGILAAFFVAVMEQANGSIVFSLFCVLWRVCAR